MKNDIRAKVVGGRLLEGALARETTVGIHVNADCFSFDARAYLGRSAEKLLLRTGQIFMTRFSITNWSSNWCNFDIFPFILGTEHTFVQYIYFAQTKSESIQKRAFMYVSV